MWVEIQFVCLFIGVLRTAAQGTDPRLTGTWSTKSNSTFTGPGFYDPYTERFTEPANPGISYSFTDDGHYEMSYYRALSNPQNPHCPRAMLQWQHGTFERLTNGSLLLTPIEVDGRQVMSDPCRDDQPRFTRFNVTELFERYEIYTDRYHNILRMDLFRFDGSALPAMYLAFRPPAMLPTSTLHTTSIATENAQATKKLKRQALGRRSSNTLPARAAETEDYVAWLDADMWWWVGLGSVAVGSVVCLCA